MSIQQYSNKSIYNMFINKVQNVPKSEDKWIENYPFLEVADWAKLYKLPFKSCRDTYLHTLQYKILHRVPNFNVFLASL